MENYNAQHRHHIIPRHEWRKRLGNLIGFNDPDNVVNLTLPQHSHVHFLLYELNGNWEDKIAGQMLSGQITREAAQKEMGRQVGLSTKGSKLKFTPEHCENLRGAKLLYWKSAEARKAARIKVTGTHKTPEQCAAQSLMMTGRKRGAYRKGIKRGPCSEATRNKISKALFKHYQK